jgi:hypothetical protein
MKNLLFGLIVACAASLSMNAAMGANAVYSKDGSQVYIADGKLKRLDLKQAPGRFESFDASAALGEDDGHPEAHSDAGIQAVSRGGDDRIFCMSNHHVVVFDPKAKGFSKIMDAADALPCFYQKAASASFEDIAVNPTNGLLLATLRAMKTADPNGDFRQEAVCLPKGWAKPLYVFNRRASSINCPAYDANGDLYFAAYGDLWKGSVDPDNDDDAKAFNKNSSRGVLNAFRVAALARLETSEGNSWVIGVCEIAVARSFLLISDSRLGGTGDGFFIVMNKPMAKVARGDTNYSADAALLKTVREVADNGGLGVNTCASPTKDQCFYQVYPEAKSESWLVGPDAKPEKWHIRQ